MEVLVFIFIPVDLIERAICVIMTLLRLTVFFYLTCPLALVFYLMDFKPLNIQALSFLPFLYPSSTEGTDAV